MNSMNKITDVQISCLNRVIIWSQTKSSENWMPALHRGTTHKEKGQPLPMLAAFQWKHLPVSWFVYVFSFATGQKVYTSHIDVNMSVLIENPLDGYYNRSRIATVAIQSIHDFRNITKQLQTARSTTPQTSVHFKMLQVRKKISYAHPPPQVFLSQMFRLFARRKISKSSIQQLKWHFRQPLQSNSSRQSPPTLVIM